VEKTVREKVAEAIRNYPEGERYPQGPGKPPEWLVEAIYNPKPSLYARVKRLLRRS
jgi:hypothetical protein